MSFSIKIDRVTEMYLPPPTSAPRSASRHPDEEWIRMEANKKKGVYKWISILASLLFLFNRTSETPIISFQYNTETKIQDKYEYL